jgi:hypothetical protein
MSTFSNIQPKDYTIEELFVSAPMSWQLLSGSNGVQVTTPDFLEGAITVQRASNVPEDFYDNLAPKINEDTGTYEYVMYRSAKHVVYSALTASAATSSVDDNILFSYSVEDNLDDVVFSRTSTATYVDKNGFVRTAQSGEVRNRHYITPSGGTAPIRTLLLEPQRTNLCIRSEEFNNAAWGNADVTVTANVITAPDGTLTADLLTSAGSNTFERVSMPCTFTGDGEKSVSCFFKAGNAALAEIEIRDATTGIAKHRIRLTWTAGVPALSSVTGAGTIYPVEGLANGWYRALFSATSVVAANNNQIRIYPTGTAQVAGTVYVWGAQAEDAAVPSSYIKTEGTTVTRNADNLYFPFTATPQALTVYVRGVERGTQTLHASFARYFQISNAANADPRFAILASSATSVRSYHDTGPIDVTSTVTNTAVLNDIRELRAVLRADGATLMAAALNGTAESVASVSSTLTLATDWSGPSLYLNSAGNSFAGMFAFTNVIIMKGQQSLTTLRDIQTASTQSVQLTTMPDEAYVISVGQQFYGDRIKPGTFELATELASKKIQDDGLGNLYTTDAGITTYLGNIFYDRGIVVVKHDIYSISTSISSDGLKLVENSELYVDYESDVKLYRHETYVKISPSDFNFSMFNPSILRTYQASGSVSASFFTASMQQENIKTSGNTEDTYNIYNLMSAGIIKPYITTIGLYNERYELLAVAKLSEPIQRTFNTDQIFVVRFDT